MESKNEAIQLIKICITNRLDFFLFLRLLKKRSGNDFIFASYMLLHPNTAQKCRKTQLYDFPLRIFFKSTVVSFKVEFKGIFTWQVVVYENLPFKKVLIFKYGYPGFLNVRSKLVVTYLLLLYTLVKRET